MVLKPHLLRRARRGQSTVEYMLYISVMVIALAAIGYTFIGPLSAGWSAFESDAQIVLSASEQGSGDMR